MLTIFGSPENLKDKVEALTISNELLREDNTALQDRVSELEEVCNFCCCCLWWRLRCWHDDNDTLQLRLRR